MTINEAKRELRAMGFRPKEYEVWMTKDLGYTDDPLSKRQRMYHISVRMGRKFIAVTYYERLFDAFRVMKAALRENCHYAD